MQEIMNLWKVCRTSSTLMNLTLHDVDGGYRKRQCKIETENCSDVLQLSLGPSQGAAEWSENSKNSKVSNADLTASHANVLQKKNGHVESNDRSQVHAEDGKKRQFLTSFDLGDHNKT